MDLKNSVKIKNHAITVEDYHIFKELLSNTVFVVTSNEKIDYKGIKFKEYVEEEYEQTNNR